MYCVDNWSLVLTRHPGEIFWKLLERFSRHPGTLAKGKLHRDKLGQMCPGIYVLKPSGANVTSLVNCAGDCSEEPLRHDTAFCLLVVALIETVIHISFTRFYKSRASSYGGLG